MNTKTLRKPENESQTDIIQDIEGAEKQVETKNEIKQIYHSDPLVRTPRLFGGVINDLKRRFPHYISDFKDGFNIQVLAAILYIYFAALSAALTFGGLLSERTEKFIGISETFIFSSVNGVIYSLFAGMPLIYVGLAGNMYLFDEALYSFCSTNNINFLSLRIWIGLWLMVIALFVAMVQGSVLVKYFTKFTKEIFTSFIGLVFIFEPFRKLYKVFEAHPLQPIEHHCNKTLQG